MSYFIKYRVVDEEDAHTQKCRLPSCLMLNSHVKTGDIVSINCGISSYICRVFPLPVTELEMCIAIDDTVSYNSFLPEGISRSSKREQLLFPDNFNVVKTTVFEKVQVKLVFHEEICFVKNEAVFKLLKNYIFKKNVIVKCDGQELADLFQIHSIVISETFPDDDTFGRLNRTTLVEVIEMVSKEQSNQLKEFEKAEISGIEDSKRHLSSCLLQKACRKVIVLGPSGCGKSVFVKKFCSDIKCYVVIIDGLKDIDLTMDKCNAYCKQLIQSSLMFPNRLSILLVDHMEELAPANPRQQRKHFVPALVYLFEQLKNSRVSVIVITTQKKFIHPAISCLFEEEVSLGIPSFYQRKEILMALTKSYSNNQCDYDKIAGMMHGFLACDITQLIQEAIEVKKKTVQIKDSAENVGLSTQHFEKALLSITPSLLKTSEWNMKIKKPVYWEDIAGMEKIKKRLQLSIERPLLHPEIFQKVGLRCPRGVLLFGPPGCCKTTLARGLATECNATFFSASRSQIYSAYVGESEKRISKLFYEARQCAPSIIFLDELDGLVGCRTFDTKKQGVDEKILSTLLNEMDGLGVKRHFGERENLDTTLSKDIEESNIVSKKQLQDEVIVVAATNRPDCIDDALLRPGRFDVIIYVPPPNLEERESILQTVTKGTPLHEVNLREIAEKTEFFSGADLKYLKNMAAKNALKQDGQNAQYVTKAHFLQTLKALKEAAILPSITREQIQMYEQLSNKYGPVISI